ncbi:hypothetical protein ACFC1R_20860 [Kitasatospora sp. NPDC056138]|uniref:hypothetical protein n=1 Tax=Kitasatospora sp. NPDC056138 TaxID=3345724 RepID=UPI0035D746DB
MTEMVPAPLRVSPTARPVTRPDHVLRRYDALHEHNGFTARVLPGALVIAHSGCTVAPGAARGQLPGHVPFTGLRCAIDLQLSRHPRIRPIRARRPRRRGSRARPRRRVPARNTGRITDPRPARPTG